MSTAPLPPEGLDGVVAFETAISQPDRLGGTLRYRGVDVEALVGRVEFEHVWALLVDGALGRPLPALVADALLVRTRDARADLQAALAMLAPQWGLAPLGGLDAARARDDLARASAMALNFVALSARGSGRAPVPESEVAAGGSAAERFLLRWRGEADLGQARAIDAYWVSAAEDGTEASTLTARVVASAGADVAAALAAAVGALSGSAQGDALGQILARLDAVERAGDAEAWVRAALDHGERLVGFGSRRGGLGGEPPGSGRGTGDPRAGVLRRTARELGAPRYAVAEAVERAALAELEARDPGSAPVTEAEYWSAVVLDHAQVPAELHTALLACARTAGWSAHVLEQRGARPIRPGARYAGSGERELGTVER